MAESKKDERDIGSLEGQELLDALTEARVTGDYKGWTFSELVHGPSVLPTTVYDETLVEEPIVKHTCVVATSFRDGRITSLTLMVTTPEGTTYQDFHANGEPHRG